MGFTGVHSVPSAQLDAVSATFTEWYTEYGNANAYLGSIAGNHSTTTIHGRALGTMFDSFPDIVEERSAIVVTGKYLNI